MLFSVLATLALGASQIASVPAPIPMGGVGVRSNDTPPVYAPGSDFDFQSLNLALNQEWIELDLFNYGVARFTVDEFAEAGMGLDDISLVNFMADQELGHAILLTNILSGFNVTPAERCTYKYDFDTVRDFVNFCQRLTRWGESGVYGFLPHLDSRASAQLLLQSISTEARQQLIFRQFSGAFPMPVYFETGISQAMAWSLLSRYIVSCPATNPHIEWQVYPWLNIVNDADLLVSGFLANITHNRTSLTEPGKVVQLSWDAPGQTVSYNNSYNTSIGGLVNTTTPRFAAWISQLNVTYTPLNVTSNCTATTIQPSGTVFNGTPDDNIANGTMFIALTSTDLPVTPYNLSLLNDYILAFGEYQAD